MVIRELTTMEILIRIGLTMVLGGLIGIDRSLKNRPAGLRTHMLVAIGACLVMMINQYIFQVFGTGDPTRMGAQVVSGIGFLGAGTIIISHSRKITGLTTAASLWASAAIGLAIGIGFYEGALIGFFAIFSAVVFLLNLDGKLEGRQRYIETYLVLKEGISLGNFIQGIKAQGYEIHDIQIEGVSSSESRKIHFVATIESKGGLSKEGLFVAFKEMDTLDYFEFL